MSDSILLSYQITRHDRDRLELSYRVENKGTQRVYLLTPLGAVAGGELAPALSGVVYAFIGEGGVLHLTKRLWPIPEGMFVYTPETPFLTSVLPGGSFEERLSLPVPVSIQYPYRTSEVTHAPGQKAPEVLVAESQGVMFSIGCLIEGEPIALGAPKTAPKPGILSLEYGTIARGQRILEGDVLDVNFIVQETTP